MSQERDNVNFYDQFEKKEFRQDVSIELLENVSDLEFEGG